MKTYFFILFVLAASWPAVGQTDTQRQSHFNIKNGLSLEGFDPVSYFDGEPRKGVEQFEVKYRGVRYWFITDRNRQRFNASPDKFEPAYGGWCAFAMGDTGEKVKVDPETFKITGGKLYLFYNFWGNNTLNDWNSNEQKLKEAGDRNWLKSVR